MNTASYIPAPEFPHRAGFSLRPSSPADRDFLWALRKNAYQDYVTRIWGWDEVDQQQRLDAEMADNPSQIIGIDGTPIGMLQSRRREGAIFIENIMVLDAWRGRGIGRQVMTAIISEARAMLCPVRLQAFKINVDAHRFYERLGFIRTGECDQWFLYEIR